MNSIHMFKGAKKFWKIVGPGVVTGAADDDPSAIAAYSQAGAQFGYSQLWTALVMLPFMVAIQEACGRIGAVTGKGLAAVMKDRYGRATLLATVLIIVVANTINIGADLGAMAASAQLVIPLPFAVLALGFTAVILILEIFLSYRSYASVLKWFALALLAYPVTVFFASQPWGEIARATFVPHIELTFPFLFIFTGVLGTTISPYMFFWQASEEVEEEKAKHMFHNGVLHLSERFLKNLKMDTFIGMFISQASTWCIIVVAATVLHANGITNINSAADAAAALEPLVSGFPNAGLLAKLIFAIGVVGLGLVSVPVLSASASYALSETLNWKEGLNLKLKKAHGFYGVITIATLIGLSINFLGIDPMKALIYTSVLNGLASVPLLFFVARIAESPTIMGAHVSSPLSRAFVWGTFAIMTIAAVCMALSYVRGA